MCGIAVIYAYSNDSPPVEREELKKICDSMLTRGPDGHGLWLSENRRIGLAHRRLSIIDLSEQADQPLCSSDGSYGIVYNGEIYNYRELREDLLKGGYAFRTNSDTEVLLNLYIDRGVDMLDELRGMYAFAIWDKVKEGLFCARDPFGIKPLYCADDGKTIRVASQVKALLKGGCVDTRADAAGHVGFYLWGFVPEPHTLYERIKPLPAGSFLWIDQKGSHNQKQYCSITSELREAENRQGDRKQNEIRDSLYDSLKESVRYHMVADVLVGLFLSSGIDSAVITALAAETVSDHIQTLTLGFEEYRGTPLDETLLAERVAQLYATSHRTIWIRKKEFQGNVSHVLENMDQPSIDGVNTYFVARAAAQSGLKVALSGLGGDELFGSYPSFTDVPRMAALFRPFEYIPYIGKGLRMVSAPILKRFTSLKYASLFEFGGSYGGAYLLRRGLFMPWELPEFLDGDMVREGWQSLQPFIRLEESIKGIKSNRMKVSGLEMTWYMRNQLLRDADWAGMAHSVEIRMPLVDIVLLKKIAPYVLTNRNINKRYLAALPASPLPDEVMERKKTGFSVPVKEWVEDYNPFQHNNIIRGNRMWAKIIMKYVYK